jgi:transposase
METFSMSGKERRRLEVLSRVRRGEASLRKGAELMGVSYRQAKRLWSRYQANGDAGLVHRLRGRASNRQVDEVAKERALSLYREKYSDYGPTLAAECLAQEDKLSLPVSSLRRWLSAAGLWQRRRKRKVHRRRRPRREQLGELVQMDGSHHDWFEGRRDWAVLMVMIDDATGRVTARFFENESWHSAASLFCTYTRERGLPRALYVDRHSIYRADREPTPDEIFTGKEPQTQFGRALEQLGVELILANSPQAKGRVERMNGTLQDRLVKALRRAGISDLVEANAFLESTFLPEFNERFSVKPTKRGDLHRVVGTSCDLDLVLSIQEERVVQNDYTVRWQNGFLQLDRESSAQVQPGGSVTVCQQLDGRLRVLHAKRELTWSPTRARPVPSPQKRSRSGPTGSSQGQRPSARHPWRRDGVGRAAASVAGLACSASVAALPPLRSPTLPRKTR